MLAAADVLAERVIKHRLVDLHGLADADLHDQITNSLGEMPFDRRQCIDACINALHSAFADFRARQIEEFGGERPLICTCFGVTEEIIEQQIEEKSLETLEQVTRVCNAGGGCGSCRMLIQEILDTRIGQI